MIRRLLILPLLLVVSAAGSLAQDQVKASLISRQTGVNPGSTFTVALRLEHIPHWHTYWINPGTGYPTSIEWDLPEGWSAGDIQWPAPLIIRDSHGTITGNGYEAVTYLPVSITAPDDAVAGSEVMLRGHADWLMCADVCIPGDSPIELTLPILSETPGPDATHHDAIESALASLRPTLPAGVSATATKSGQVITLKLSGLDGKIPEPWFFAEDALVQFDLPQSADQSTPGELTLTLPVGGNSAPTTSAGNAPGSLIGTLALAFVGGLILNLMPCVFPVLGIKIMGFVNQAGEDRRKVAMHGWVFSLGVLASFLSLATILAVLRAGGDQLGWGFQLQSPAFVFVLAAVMLVFAMAMSGVFQFGLSATGVGAKLQSKDGLTGSFFTGVLATVDNLFSSSPPSRRD